MHSCAVPAMKALTTCLAAQLFTMKGQLSAEEVRLLMWQARALLQNDQMCKQAALPRASNVEHPGVVSSLSGFRLVLRTPLC